MILSLSHFLRVLMVIHNRGLSQRVGFLLLLILIPNALDALKAVFRIHIILPDPVISWYDMYLQLWIRLEKNKPKHWNILLIITLIMFNFRKIKWNSTFNKKFYGIKSGSSSHVKSRFRMQIRIFLFYTDIRIWTNMTRDSKHGL